MLSLCNWIYKDLSMSHDHKATTIQPPMDKWPMDVYKVLFLLPKFDNSSPSVTRNKRDLSHDYEIMTSLPPEEEYPMEPFE